MADVLWGTVTNIVDGDTFDLHVTHCGQMKKLQYGNQERIRIAGTDAPELGSRSGLNAKLHLERVLKGRRVRCDIQARDKYGRLVCFVSFSS